MVPLQAFIRRERMGWVSEDRVMRWMGIAAAVMAFSPVQAQDIVQAQDMAPRNVNDCTFLTDPIQLRICIDDFEARYPQNAPSGGSDSGAAPRMTGSLRITPDAATKQSIRRSGGRISRAKESLTPSEKTRIEQIGRR